MTREEMMEVVAKTLDGITSDPAYSDAFTYPIVDALCDIMIEELDDPAAPKRRKRDNYAARKRWALLSPAARDALIDAEGTTTGRKHPKTSHATAEAVLEKTGKQRRKVYNYIVSRGAEGATDDEIGEALGLDGNSVRPRRNELADMGAIMLNGKQRLNRLGNWCNVWVVTS